MDYCYFIHPGPREDNGDIPCWYEDRSSSVLAQIMWIWYYVFDPTLLWLDKFSAKMFWLKSTAWWLRWWVDASTTTWLWSCGYQTQVWYGLHYGRTWNVPPSIWTLMENNLQWHWHRKIDIFMNILKELHSFWIVIFFVDDNSDYRLPT